jgi:hypothetical protein
MRKQPSFLSGGSGAALVVTYGNTSRKHRPLDRDLTLLGRARNCDVALVSPEVAPIHCLIARGADGWLLRDCTGRGGTRLNGKAVTESVLADGDMLQVGTFSFQLQLPQPGPALTQAAFQRLQRSRRNLAYLALELRKKLRLVRACVASQQDRDEEAQQMRSLQHNLDNRRRQLQQAETAFRQAQAAQEQQLAARGQQLQAAEAHLRVQRAELDQGMRQAKEAHARRVEELQRLAAAAPSPEKIADLQKREQKLAELASKLRHARKQLQQQVRALALKKAQLRQEQAAAAQSPELARLRGEVELLRRELAEQKAVSDAQRAELQAVRAVEGAQAAVAELSGGAPMQELIASLREEIRGRDALLEKMNRRLKQHASRADEDTESYEAELNRYRLELERERRDLNDQIRQMKQRHAEIEEAAREAEVQMARERAQLAREQAELNRLRQELSRAQNRSPREQEVRERLAAIKRPREEGTVPPQKASAPATGLRRRNLVGRPTPAQA